MTIKEVKESIQLYNEKNQFDYENRQDEFSLKLFNQPIENFEIIKNERNNKLYVMPCINNVPLLYRGQSQEFTPCLPTLYRQNPTPIQIFIERLRLTEFKHLLLSHPLVKHYIDKGFNLDIEGLAQHYGLKTEILDFSSDIDIALFFAMCPYDSELDDYTIPKWDGIMQGIIYVLNPILYDTRAMSINHCDIFIDKVEPIGLQPFERPAAQRGFGVRLRQGEHLCRVRVFDFEYTKEEAEEYYNKFCELSNLWIKDELIAPTRYIMNKKHFSYIIFKETWDNYCLEGLSKSQCIKQLGLYSIRIHRNNTIYSFKDFPFEENILSDRWNKYTNRVTSRTILQTTAENPEWHLKTNYMTTEDLALIQMLRFGQSGLTYPSGTRLCRD